MKVADWKRVVRPLLPEGVTWDFRGGLCYRAPAEMVLEGVLGEGSALDKGVYIWRVAMPLFIPNDTINLSWSTRIGGGAKKYTNDDRDALEKAIRTALEQSSSDDGMSVIASTDEERNARIVEARAYALLLLDSLEEGRRTLDAILDRTQDARRVEDVRGRVLLIADLLQEGRLGAVRTQFERWQKQTCGALGLRYQ